MDNPPADLQTVLRIMNEWRPMHTEDDVVKVPGNPPLLDLGLSLPHDINAYPFSRYAAKYIRDHRLGLTEDPIRFPFLPKFTALDNRDSVELFRLIMSFMFDGDPREERRLMLANYVVQKGLSSDQLRDEIYVQLVNQTLGQRSRSPQSPVAVWTLMASCLSVFPPSTQLANHLLKYVSDAGLDGFNAVCQHKLLQCIGLAPELARSYPPCLLEWTANRARAAMALHVVFSDGEKGISQVESWTTAEEFAANTFRSRHIADRITGWNVQLRDDVDTYECAGYDYVIDLISEMELPPSFPCSTAYFLTMTDLSRPASTTGRQHWPEEPHNAERLRLMPLEVDELADQPLASLAPQIHPPRARTPTPPRVYTPSPPPNRPSVVEADEPPSPPPLRKQPPDLIQVNPEEVYIHSEQAISQGSALNRRKDHVPSELSKKSVLNSRYAAKVVVEPEPEPGWDGPARRNNQKPAHQKQAPARQQQQKQQQQKQPQQKQHQQQQKQPEPANRSGDDDDMVAWVDDIFKQALGGQPAGHPVQDLGNSQALARNMKGGGDNLPLQLGLGATGTGVYGIAPFGLQPPAAIQPPSAFAQPVMPMMQSPPVLPSLVNPTIPGTLVPNGLPTGLPVSMDPTTIQFMQQQQLLQQQQQQVQQAQQMQHQQQQQQMLQHIRIQQQQQMQIQQHAADLQAQLQVKELEKQVLTSSLQTEMLKQQLEQIQNKKERVTPPTPTADALSKRQSFRDDAPPSQPPRPVSANYSYQAPRPEHHQNHRVEDGVDLYRQGGVNALKRPYLNQNNNFRAAPRHPAAPVVIRHPQLSPASPATRAKAKTKGVKFVDVSDDEDDDDESTSAAPRPRPASPPIQKKEGKKVPVQPASSKNQVWKPAVPAVKAVPEVKSEAPRKPLGSSVVANGQPEPSNARRVPGKIGIKWPPEAEKADARPSVEVNRLVITEVKEVTPTVKRTQSTNDVQQKINSRIRSSQEAAQKNAAAAAAHRKHVPPPAPVKAQPKILTEEAGTQSENWSNVDMATKKKELEKMLKGVQWGTQREKDPPAHPRPPPLHAPPLPAAAAPPPPPSFVPMAASPRDIYESIPDNGLSRLDNIRTALHSQCTGPFFTYRHSDWTLEIKKEVFSPLEKLRNPILVDLVFAQVVGDVLSGDSIRINAEDKRKMKKLLDGHGVNLRNVGSHHSIQVKTAVIRAAKDLPLLFSRLFPVNGGSKYIGLQMVGVSHSGVRLLARNKDVFEDTIVVFETIKFSEIVDVHVPKSSTLLMRLKGRNVVFYTKYATHMRDMLSTYRKEDSEIILQTRMADTDED